MSAHAAEELSAVEAGQMSAAETGQTSAVETGQMSAAETGQMSVIKCRKTTGFHCFFYAAGPVPASGGARSRPLGEGVHKKNPSLALSGT